MLNCALQAEELGMGSASVQIVNYRCRVFISTTPKDLCIGRIAPGFGIRPKPGAAFIPS